jgi:hypothetical protein
MLVSADEGEDDDDAFGSYAFLEGDSSHSRAGNGLGLGVLADGRHCPSDDEDQYEEVVLSGGLDSGAPESGGAHTGRAEHDLHSRRASDVSLLGRHL